MGMPIVQFGPRWSESVCPQRAGKAVKVKRPGAGSRAIGLAVTETLLEGRAKMPECA